MSNSVNYENQILNAIETIVNNAVNNANYDKTIKAQIIKLTNANLGEYKVKYQDTTFFAYSTNLDIQYQEGTLVYILVPNNDMKQVKTIIGAVEKNEIEYIDVLETEDYYEVIGTNTCNDTAEYGLCSYNGENSIILYDKDNDINLINYDELAFEEYLKNADNIMCGGWFKTSLDPEQRRQGTYGLSFEIVFQDELDEELIITKNYSIDVNNMRGNPYNFIDYIRQTRVFDINTDKFIEVKNITFFAKGFPNTEANHNNDIFIKTPILYAVSEIPEAQLNGYYANIKTEKTYFTNDDSEDSYTNLAAIAKIKNKTVSEDANIQYYWFKENSEIYPTMIGYSSYGGAGWECLNSYNILNSDTNEIEYITNLKSINVYKRDCLAGDNNYKLVIIFNDTVSQESILNIKNYDALYNLKIVSDLGTEFYYGNGTPTLKLLINNLDNFYNNFTYKWSVIDENSIFTSLDETTSLNTQYTTILNNYNTLLASIQNETILPQAAAAQLEAYQNALANFDSIRRIDGNKVYKIQTNEINEYNIYKCSVYNEEDILIGTASIQIWNYPKIEGEYTLNIINGTQTFNYSSAGIAPTSETLERPMKLQPLSFTIVDNKGNFLPENILKYVKVQWTVPQENSLLVGINSTDPTLDYSLVENYDINKTNNTIKLDIQYQELNLHAETNFAFIKDGQPGTNGTDVVCKIIPNTAQTFDEYPILYYNNNGNYGFNFTPESNYRWFKVQLWQNNELLWEGTNSKKVDNIVVKWSNLINNYGEDANHNTVSDLSHIRIVESSGISDVYHNYYFYFNDIDENLQTNQDVADIIKAEVNYNGKQYYCTLPIITVKTEDWNNYKFKLVKDTGFRYVVYGGNGIGPEYENVIPFTLKITEKINGFTEDISTLTNNSHKLTYNWAICGCDYYNNSWHISHDLTLNEAVNNTGSYIPVYEYKGKNLTNGLKITMTQNNNQLAIMHIPIHFYLDRYEISTINDWDGNHIEINENKDSILAPQVGAGKKEADNSFTGVFMGELLGAGARDSRYGLYGYYQGDQTIELNAENGSAKFGKAGAGQIVLDPTDDTAVLRSGNYIAPVLDDDGNIVQAGQGLEIDLTDPHITFGTGNFRVTNTGDVYAQGYATIAKLENGDYEIPSSSVENLDTFISTTNSSIEDLQSQIDGNITTWFYAYAPTLNNEPASTWTTTTDKDNHLGDLFYDTTTGYCYRFMKTNNVYSWGQLSDSDIAAALAAAQTAQDTADNKRRVFFTTPIPPYDQGDLWAQGNNGDLLRCNVAKTASQSYAITDWILASKYTDDTTINTLKPSLITSVIVEYALGNDSQTAPTTGWSTQAPVWEDGKYMWQRTTSVYADDTQASPHRVTSNPTCIAGASGQNAYTVILTNESQSIAATSNGAAIATTITTGVTAYKGATLKATIVGANASATTFNTGITGITATINNNNTTSTSIVFGVTTELVTQTGSITVPITVDGIQFDKKFTFSLSKAGADGAGGSSPTAYNLVVSHAAIVKTKTNTYSPTSLSFYATSQTGNSAITTYTDGSYRITKDNEPAGSWINIASSNVYDISTTAPIQAIKIELSKENASSSTHTIIDNQTIPIVFDGTDGINGTSPYIAFLTNESQTFTYGTAKDITTDLYAYQGISEKTVQIKTVNGVNASTSTTATGKTGMNFKVSSTSAVTHPTITFSSTASLAQSQTEQIAIVFRITGESSDRTLYFSYSSTTQGASGEDAKLVNIMASDQVFKSMDGGTTFSPNTIVLTPNFQNLTYNAWYYILDGGSPTNIISGQHGLTIDNNTKALTISKTSDLYTASRSSVVFKCEATDTAFYDTMTIVKLYDVSDIEVGGRNYYSIANSNEGYLNSNESIALGPMNETRQEHTSSFIPVSPGEQWIFQNWVTPSDATANEYLWMAYQFYSSVTTPSGNVITKTAGASTGLPQYEYLKFTIPAGTLYIRVSARFYNNGLIKLEKGTVPTDWSVCPEDTEADLGDAISSLVIPGVPLYCYTTSFITQPLLPGQAGAPTWSNTYQVQDNKYLWQTTPSKTGNIITYTTPICLTAPRIANIYQEYYVSSDSTVSPSPSLNWSVTIPQWVSGQFLWVRNVTVYESSEQKYYSNYHIDNSWSASSGLNDKLDYYNNKLNELMDEKDSSGATGSIKYSGSTMEVLSADKLHRLVINDQGIGFQSRATTSSAWSNLTSVWTLDGTFDAQNIDVKNLTAEAIVNGDLSIGKNFNQTQNNGILKIYDDQDNLVIRGSGNDGLTFSKTDASNSNNIHTKISKTSGISGYDTAGNKIYEHQNEQFYTKRQKTDEYLIIGNVKILAVSGTRNGIGFVAN